MNCNKKDCTSEAEFAVILELRATKGGVSAQSTPIVVVCKEHSDVEWKDVYHEESFNRLADMFERMGRMRPVKEYSNIAIIRIKDLPEDIRKMYDKIQSSSPPKQ